MQAAADQLLVLAVLGDCLATVQRARPMPVAGGSGVHPVAEVELSARQLDHTDLCSQQFAVREWGRETTQSVRSQTQKNALLYCLTIRTLLQHQPGPPGQAGRIVRDHQAAADPLHVPRVISDCQPSDEGRAENK